MKLYRVKSPNIYSLYLDRERERHINVKDKKDDSLLLEKVKKKLYKAIHLRTGKVGFMKIGIHSDFDNIYKEVEI